MARTSTPNQKRNISIAQMAKLGQQLTNIGQRLQGFSQNMGSLQAGTAGKRTARRSAQTAAGAV
jgi:hypothetical protein